MKKLFLIPLMLLATIAFAASCNEDEHITDGEGQIIPEENEAEGDMDGTNGRYLVLYCSRTGNTERMAQTIQSALDCDMIIVEPETPYENDYNTMLDRAQAELDAIEQGNYPAITTSVESFDKYDIVFIGYPIWYSHMATPMQTFLHNHADLLAGKRIALFASSGSSGIGTSERDAVTLVPDAVFEESLLLTSGTLGSMDTRIPAWLEEIGANREDNQENANESLGVNIIVGDQTITATLEDNSAARDFFSRLPLEVTLEGGEVLTASLAGREWAEGNTVIYRISHDPAVIEGELKVPIDPIVFSYLGGTGEFSVKSQYKVIEGESFEIVNAPWVATFYDESGEKRLIAPHGCPAFRRKARAVRRKKRILLT